MSNEGAKETPMSDHIERFWKLLRTSHVRILVENRVDHDEGQPSHWDSSSFPDDVAKALAAEHEMLTDIFLSSCTDE